MHKANHNVTRSINNTPKQQKIKWYTKHKFAYQTQTYGESMPLKNPDEYRIVCNNLGCIGVEVTGNIKQKLNELTCLFYLDSVNQDRLTSCYE